MTQPASCRSNQSSNQSNQVMPHPVQEVCSSLHQLTQGRTATYFVCYGVDVDVGGWVSLGMGGWVWLDMAGWWLHGWVCLVLGNMQIKCTICTDISHSYRHHPYCIHYIPCLYLCITGCLYISTIRWTLQILCRHDLVLSSHDWLQCVQCENRLKPWNNCMQS